ncbi:MAG: hypothetical protein QGF59_31350, partial [Pirellulaceae bacterium]|nr:hypothetical protein [Pirellulaceae bacterium]
LREIFPHVQFVATTYETPIHRFGGFRRQRGNDRMLAGRANHLMVWRLSFLTRRLIAFGTGENHIHGKGVPDSNNADTFRITPRVPVALIPHHIG